MNHFYNKKKKMLLGIGLLCLVVLGGVFLVSAFTKGDSSPISEEKLLISAYPEKYTLAMSNVPGIRISVRYLDSSNVGKVRYSSTSGGLLTWNGTEGSVSKGSTTLELPYGTLVFWSPLATDGKAFTGKENKITIAILNKQGNVLEDKQVYVQYDGSMYYHVQPSPNVVVDFDTYPKNLDQAVSMVIKAQGKYYRQGELITEVEL